MTRLTDNDILNPDILNPWNRKDKFMDKPAITMHDINAYARKRWSPRSFADKAVDPKTLASLFEAARWAPSCFNAQPWAFIVATKDEPEGYEKLLSCLIEYNQGWARSAPVLALSVAQNNFAHNGEPNAHALHDVGMAALSLTLEAAARDLYVHQMAGFDAGKARAAFGIPEEWTPVAALAIGFKGAPDALPDSLAEKEKAPRERKPLSAFVYSGAWGQAAGLAGD